MKKLLSVLACGLLFTLAPARAADIPVEPGARFEHGHSHIVIPPTLAGLPRVRAVEFAPDQLDVAFNFADPDAGEVVTLYIYRLVSGSLPVWFDRARWIIENNPGFGRPTPAAYGAFVPPGQPKPSGLVAMYDTEGRHRSTGVAIVPVGEWLVKLRLSSATLTSQQLRARIDSVLLETGWPMRIPDAPAAAPVKPCATPLVARRAKPLPDNGAGALLGAALGLPATIRAATGEDAPAPLAQWCRDDSVEPAGTVFRPDDASDRYLIALSDAGRGILVQPDPASALLGKRKGKSGWSVEFLDLGTTTAFPVQDGLPPPAQAIQIAENDSYVTSVPTWGDKKTITVNSDAMKSR